MASYTPDQIYAAARQAGFSASQAVTMTAIALAESGGNVSASNTSGEDSHGLWQINMDAHRQWVNEMGLDLTNPYDNAVAAFHVSGGGASISPWTVTHQSKGAAYLNFRAQAEDAATNAGEPATGNWSASPGYGSTVPAGDAGGPAWTGSAPAASGGTSVAGESDPTMDPRTAEQYAIEEYGQYAAFLSQPEIGPILLQAAAAKPPWSEAVLEGELHKTAWWQSTNQSVRQWMALDSSDHMEAESQVNAQTANIMARANQLGFPTTRSRAEAIARDSLKFGWKGAELDRAIGMDNSQQQLLTSSFGTSLKSTASQFGIPVSDSTIGSWATRIASGEDTEENFASWARDMAANMYPTATAHLARGGTIQEFFDPYREQAAKILQINPSTIDLSDPKWGAALSIKDPTGESRAMRSDEWQKMLMSDDKYGFRYTKNAKDMAEASVDGLKRMFGVTT